MYKCKFCGREFEKQQAWASHQCKCKLNPDRGKYLKQLEHAREVITNHVCGFNEDKNEYVCQYCGKICVGKNSLTQHELRCKENPNRLKIVSNFVKYNENCRKGVTHHPHKGQTKETCDSLKRGAETRKKKYESGELKGSFVNRHHSEETKEKMRQSAFKYLQEVKDVQCPRYNKGSIEFIDKLNEANGWHLQHAENGGEIEICGYFLDGYDKNLNIAFEYDEPSHYKNIDECILNDRDVERQKRIIEETDCTFYRYNEQKGILYKITK